MDRILIGYLNDGRRIKHLNYMCKFLSQSTYCHKYTIIILSSEKTTLNICKEISFIPVDLIEKKSFVPSPFGVNTFGISKLKPSFITIVAYAVSEHGPEEAISIIVNVPFVL